jgi:hypothetical protein
VYVIVAVIVDGELTRCCSGFLVNVELLGRLVCQRRGQVVLRPWNRSMPAALLMFQLGRLSCVRVTCRRERPSEPVD